MQKLVPTIAILSVILAVSPALAADTTGVVRAINPGACTVTVRKTVYKFDKACDLSKLTVGEKVTITYSRAGTTLYARAIKPA